MTAKIYNITVDQGSDFELPFIWQDSSGNAKDLTGYTARMHVRKNFNDLVQVLSLTTENGGLEISPGIGKITIKINGLDTASINIDPNSVDILDLTSIYYYDLEVVSSSSVVTQLLRGRFYLRAEVTR